MTVIIKFVSFFRLSLSLAVVKNVFVPNYLTFFNSLERKSLLCYHIWVNLCLSSQLCLITMDNIEHYPKLFTFSLQIKSNPEKIDNSLLVKIVLRRKIKTKIRAKANAKTFWNTLPRRALKIPCDKPCVSGTRSGPAHQTVRSEVKPSVSR